MKKTIYFTKRISWRKAEEGCTDVVIQRDEFISKNSNKVKNTDSEELRVDYIGNNSAVCILRYSYFEEE